MLGSIRSVRVTLTFVALAASVSTLPSQSIHVSSRTPMVSITRVSPDHFPDEYPCHEGFGSSGNGRASVNTWR